MNSLGYRLRIWILYMVLGAPDDQRNRALQAMQAHTLISRALSRTLHTMISRPAQVVITSMS